MCANPARRLPDAETNAPVARLPLPLPLLLLVPVLSILGTATLSAATLQVTTADDTLDGPDCSLRAAILAADSDAPVGGCPAGAPGLDRVDVPAGIFTLDLFDPPPQQTCGPDGDEPCPPEDEDAGASGDLDLRGPVEIVGAGRGETLVESVAGLGGPPARVFEVHGGSTVVLRELTIRYGRPHPLEPGAGLAVGPGASLHLSDCRVAGNETDGSGGGLYAGPRSSVVVERCKFRDNVGFGGALSGVSASVALRDSGVMNNRASVAGGGGGLALVGGEATIEQSLLLGNSADDTRWGGGGILALGGRVTLRDSTLFQNTATDASDDGSGSDVELDETGGGGLAAFSAEIRLENTTFTGNLAHESRWGGGGTLSIFSEVEIVHSTFRGNVSAGALTSGGSLSAVGSGDPLGSVAVAHSIFAGAVPAECDALLGPADPAPAGTTNLVDDGSCGTSVDSLGPVVGLADSPNGPAWAYRLLEGSNAVDAGPAECIGLDGLPLAFDQRGVARPQGSGCDLGAVERTTSLALAISGEALGTVFEPGGTVAVALTFESSDPLPLKVALQPAPELTNLGTCGAEVAVAPGEVVICQIELTVAASAGPLVVDLEALAISPDLEESVGVPILLDVLPPPDPHIFEDGFETGDLSAWSGSVGG